MSDDIYVDVRVRVHRSVYRELFAEAQRRRLDGAGDLIALMLHRQPPPRRSPRQPHDKRRVIPTDRVPEILERVLDREESVRSIAKEFGVSRAAIQRYTRPEKDRREAEAAAAHAAALVELGITGRPPITDPAVPTL